MRFANANDNFEIMKIIIINMITRSLTDFMQRQIKFHIFIIIINIFLLLQIKSAMLIKT